MVRLLRLSVVLMVLLALPATASAARLCVGAGSGCDQSFSGDTAGLNAALNAANGDAGRDEITVAAGSYESSSVFEATQPVDIVGAGDGAGGTTLANTSDSGTTLYFSGAGSSVSNVRIQRPRTGTGLWLIGGNATAVTIIPPGAVGSGTGVRVESGNNLLSRVTVAFSADSSHGIAGDAAASLDIEDSSISGGAFGIRFSGVSLGVRRTVVQSQQAISVDAANTSSASISDSVVVMRPVPADSGFQDALGIGVSAAGSASASLTVDGVTVIGLPVTIGGQPVGEGIVAYSNGSGGVSATVTNSIVRGTDYSLYRGATPGATAPANLTASNSDYEFGKVESFGIGTLTAGPAQGNVDVDPKYRGSNDYRLRADSPLIDAAVPPNSGLDVAGQPRGVDGNGDNDPRSDIGAFEYQLQAPVAVAKTTATTVDALEVFEVDGTDSSEPEPGDRIAAYFWQFSDGTFSSDAKVNVQFATPGTYTAVLRVTDTTGMSATDTLTIQVRESAGGGGGGGGDIPVDAPPPGAGPELGACTTELLGTPAADRLSGGAGSELIHGFAGNDVLAGGAGDDCLFGEGGADKLSGGGGSDALDGGGGRDRLVGAGGRDVLKGEGQADVLFGGAKGDNLFGGAAGDKLTGGGGVDFYAGGVGRDLINARDGKAETVDCGGGRDRAIVDRADRVRNCERVQKPGRRG